MAKFIYRMQNILELKQKIEEQEKANFGMATARFNEEQDKLRKLMIKQAGYERQLKELSVGDIDIKAIYLFHRYLSQQSTRKDARNG